MKRVSAAVLASALIAAIFLAAPASAADGTAGAAAQAENPAQQAGGGDAGAAYGSVQWFREPADRYYEESNYSSNRYAYTQDELMMLATVIHLEVRGEPYEAMLAVGNVVMNRVLAPGFPGDTIREVVTRPNQFCYNPSVRPMAICVKAAREVLEDEVWVIPQNVYYFRAVENRGNWGKHIYYRHIGATAFYRDFYSGRSNSAGVPEALYRRVCEWPQYGCEPGLRVARLQKMLRSLGYKVEPDGYFDTGTRAAVRRFQQSEGLQADGVANPATLNRMMEKSEGKSGLVLR